MVLASHLIITAYGFWLPNDPRGSWSDFVGSWELWKFGDATKVNSRTSRARIAHDKSHREAARAALKYPPVEFNGTQARAIARGFATYIERAGHLVWACSILPNHVHMVVARSHLKIESIATQLKGAATRRIIEEGIHPLAAYQKPKSTRPPKMWARGEWKVFLDSIEDIRRAIRYVEDNPLKEGKHSIRRPSRERSARASRLNNGSTANMCPVSRAMPRSSTTPEFPEEPKNWALRGRHR